MWIPVLKTIQNKASILQSEWYNREAAALGTYEKHRKWDTDVNALLQKIMQGQRGRALWEMERTGAAFTVPYRASDMK